VVFLTRSAVAEQLDAWQVLPQPERFSELYFTDYRQLPTSLIPGPSQKVSFTIHNLERQIVTYQYKLVALSPASDTGRVLSSGSCTLANNETRNIRRVVMIPDLGTRRQLRIDLSYVSLTAGNKRPVVETQSIHYQSDLMRPTTVGKGR